MKTLKIVNIYQEKNNFEIAFMNNETLSKMSFSDNFEGEKGRLDL